MIGSFSYVKMKGEYSSHLSGRLISILVCRFNILMYADAEAVNHLTTEPRANGK